MLRYKHGDRLPQKLSPQARMNSPTIRCKEGTEGRRKRGQTVASTAQPSPGEQQVRPHNESLCLAGLGWASPDWAQLGGVGKVMLDRAGLGDPTQARLDRPDPG